MYKFYFDESYHDRKIIIRESGINTFAANLSDSYVGFFWGAKENIIDEIFEKYLEIEEKYKKILGIEKEFKATTFSLKNFRFGIKSFNKDCFNFYLDFFDLMDRNDIVIQYDIISKIEFLIVRVFDLNLQRNRKVIESFKISVQLFIYSLSKFIKCAKTNGARIKTAKSSMDINAITNLTMVLRILELKQGLTIQKVVILEKYAIGN